MLVDIVFAKPRKNYLLYLKFEDGFRGVIDIQKMIEFTGVFAPLKDWSFFKKVKACPELGTVTWPNHADLDTVVLYNSIKERKKNYDDVANVY